MIKYGKFSDEQAKKLKEEAHSMIHLLLVYYENENPTLSEYFDKVQLKLFALNELMDYPLYIADVIHSVECARLEYQKKQSNYRTYRRFVLDAHAKLDNTDEH